MQVAVTPQETFELMTTQKFLAQQGNTFAVRFVYEYTIGKPVTMTEMFAKEREGTVRDRTHNRCSALFSGLAGRDKHYLCRILLSRKCSTAFGSFSRWR